MQTPPVPAPAATPEQIADAALAFLCQTLTNRNVGTEDNRRATLWLESQLAALGWPTERQPFDCLDWSSSGATLIAAGEAFVVQPSPYSLPCSVEAPLYACASLEALEAAPNPLPGILLLHGPIAAEQLMPRNYPFYNPEENQRVYAAVEARNPPAVLAATGRNSSLAGGIYPFPLFEDGDFNIPSAFMTDGEGERLLAAQPARVRLAISAERRPATGWNVVARRGPAAPSASLLFTAHVDAKPTTPGALDNAAGVVTLLLLAAELADYDGLRAVELLFVNGEDHYSAAGELAYLAQRGETLAATPLAVNVDGAGYRGHPTAWSLYGLQPEMEAVVRPILAASPALVEGEPWFQSDHAVFVQQGIPAIAFVTAEFGAVWATIAHTAADTPAIVDTTQLAELARVLARMVRTL